MRTFSGGFLRPAKNRGSVIPMYWGDGSDGILSAGTTYHAKDAEGVGDFDKYSGFCIKQFTEINWVPGSPETLTVDEPCRGLILFIDGDVNIGANATISMAKMGSILPANPVELLDLYHESKQMRYIVDTLKGLAGGTGGNGGRGGAYNGSGGAGGSGGTGRICLGGFGGGGGGGGGGATGGAGAAVIYPEVIGHSGQGRAYSSKNGYSGWNGGAGGGGGQTYPEGEPNSTGGGFMYGGGPGGGAWGSSFCRGNQSEHTGGLILIIAKGSITITGILDVTGGAGGDGGSGSARGGGGGGAGGGVIAVFSRGAIDTTAAVKTLTGGAGGSGANSGTTGGQGTYYEEQL